MENNALNNMNFNQAAATSSEEKKVNNVYLNLKVKTKSGDTRRFSFLLCTTGGGLEHNNARNIVAAALEKSKTEKLDAVNRYLESIFVGSVEEAKCSLSGIQSAAKDWVNDF